MSILADRMKAIKPSSTFAIDTRVKQLQAAGGDIINLGVGEPDFDTPAHIKEAAAKAMREGYTRYTPVAGILRLREAIVDKFQRDNQLSYAPEQILVSNGAKQSIFNAMQALINPGDEVLIPAPYWVSYPDMALLAGGVPVIINSSIATHYKLTPEALSAHITPKTKLLILNSPNNPSGMVYTKEELAALAQILLEHPQIMIISDDIYEQVRWTGQDFVNIVNACPALYARTLVVNGMSKAYAMTGWRMGYMAGEKSLINAMTTVQSQSTSNANSITQYAALAALNESQQCVDDMRQAYHQRYQAVHAGLNRIPGFSCPASQGAFYCLPDVSACLREHPGLSDDFDLAELLLSRAGVAVIPGSAFGMPNTIRLSFAADIQALNEALIRIHTVLTEA